MMRLLEVPMRQFCAPCIKTAIKRSRKVITPICGLKNRLGENGFSWDDTKQMVLASDKYTSFWFTFWFDLYLWGDIELT